jgi:hypothetical protein
MPGARAGGLGSVRVEAIGFRHCEQNGTSSLTALPQPGQKIVAIPVQPLRIGFLHATPLRRLRARIDELTVTVR